MADPRFFTNKGPFSFEDVLKIAQATCEDNFDHSLSFNDVAPLNTAQSDQISFFDNVKYKDQLQNTKAGACIIAPANKDLLPPSCIPILTDQPYLAYALVAQMFYPLRQSAGSIDPTAQIHKTAQIADDVVIEAYTVIGAGVTIGQGSHIGSHVSLSHCLVGDHVRIHNGARIGQDGFGFALGKNGAVPVPQLGRVVIENHVNIGANTCIDRGAGPDSIIGQGTIIDNLVQIGHNVQVGKGCVIVSQTGISGSTHIDDYCVFGGQSGVAGHLHIGSGVQVGAQSGVTKDIPAGQKVMGFPARPIREFWREMAMIKKHLSK